MNTTLDPRFEFEAQALFQKTPLGVGEIKSRAMGLGPKTRQLLIVIDGHKTCQDLLRIMPQAELQEQLALLTAALLIERLDTTEHFYAPNGNASQSTFSPTFAPTQASQTLLDPLIDMVTARSRISHALIDTMGPHGETLASRVEKAKDFQEIKELLATIAPAVEAFGGRSALQAFVQRVGKIL
jgi:hypothetical protein